MTIRNISVKVSANVAQYTAAMNKAATATKQFSAATNQTTGYSKQAAGMQKVGTSAQKASQGMNMFKRSVGGGLTRELGHTSAVAHRSNKIFNAMAGASGVAAKGMAALKVATMATLSAFAGFIFINSAIQAVKSFFSVTIGGFTEFNTAITQTMAIIPDATGEIEKAFSETAQQIAKITKFSPGEIAEGFYFLASAGYTSAQAMASMQQVSQFAQAGLMDLAKAAEIAADTTAALGLSDKFDPKGTADSLARVTDVMVELAIASNATVEQFGQAFTNKFANMLNITNKSVEEGGAVLAAFANQGIKGQIAGTRASIAIRDLQRAALKNGAAFNDMNIQVFDSTGKMANMADIIGDMEEHLDGLSDKQKKAALSTLGFQDRSVQAILALIGQSDAIREYEERMLDAGGAVEEVANKQMKSLSARMNQMVSIIKSFSAELGGKFIKLVEKGVKELAPAFDDLWQGVKKVAGAIGSIVKPFLVIGGAAVKGAVKALGAAMKVLGELMQRFSGIFAGMALLWVANLASVQSAAAVAFTAIQGGVINVIFGLGRLKASIISTGMSIRAAFQNPGAVISALKTKIMGLGASLRAAMGSAKGFGAALASIGTSAFMAALLAVPMALSVFSNSTNNAKKEVQELLGTMGDLDSLDKMEAAYASLYEQMTEGFERSKEGGFFKELGQNLNPFAKNTILEGKELVRATEEQQKKIQESYTRTKDNIGLIRKEVKVSSDVVESTARRIGVSLDAEGSQATEAVETVIGALQEQTAGMDQAALAAGEYSDAASEDFEAVAAESTDSTKEMVDNLQKMYGPGGAMERAVIRSEALFSQLKNPNEVFGDLSSELEDQANEAAEAQAEAFNAGVEGRVDALQDAKEDAGKIHDKAIKDAKKKEKDGLKEIKDAALDSYDDQIEALKETKKEQEDFYKKPTVSLASFEAALKASSEKSATFNAKLGELANNNVSTSVLTMFREMGEEALPILDELLAGGADRIQAFNALAGTVGEEVEVDMDVFRKELEEGVARGKEFSEDALTVAANVDLSRFNLPEGTTTTSLLEQLLGMGPEGAELIAQMADDIAEGGDDAVARTEELLNQVFWTNDFMGILSSMNMTMQAAEIAAKMGAEEIEQLFMGSVDVLNQDFLDSMARLQQELGKSEIGGIDYSKLSTDYKARTAQDRSDAEVNRLATAAGITLPGRSAPEHLADPFGSGRVDMHGAARSAFSNLPRVAAPPGGGSKYLPKGMKRGDRYWDTRSQRERKAGFYADGGFHNAQIARGGPVRIWNEPETGGEAYIPLSPAKRGRSEHILKQVANEFGFGLMKFANGGIHNGPAGFGMIGAGRYGTQAAQATQVVVPVSNNNVTQFNGPIQGVNMEDAVKFAERKKRQRRLTN